MRELEETVDNWFMRKVLPHEPALLRYLYRHWRGCPTEVKDLCQEVLTRVYSASLKERPAKVKSFVFCTARNLISDLVRRERVVRIDTVMDMENLDIAGEDICIETQVSARQELVSLQSALETLPRKSRQVVELRRVHGYSQKETAKCLGITEAAVEAHIQRGVQRLSEALKDNSDIAAARFEAKNKRYSKRGKE